MRRTRARSKQTCVLVLRRFSSRTSHTTARAHAQCTRQRICRAADRRCLVGAAARTHVRCDRSTSSTASFTQQPGLASTSGRCQTVQHRAATRVEIDTRRAHFCKKPFNKNVFTTGSRQSTLWILSGFTSLFGKTACAHVVAAMRTLAQHSFV